MTDHRSVAGVVLAAGLSNRFGEGDKLLATLDGDPLVTHAVRTLVRADIGAVAAVVAPDSGVVATLESTVPGVELVGNPDAAAGQATSVHRAVAWARGSHDAVVFALGDMPRVRPETIDRLVEAWRADAGSALAPRYGGQRGNPVLFDREHFDALAAVSGDTGGRSVFENAPDSGFVDVDDPGVRVDVDTRADLEDLRARDDEHGDEREND
jgi:molybdenum cofactor cytidylyltransferase